MNEKKPPQPRAPRLFGDTLPGYSVWIIWAITLIAIPLLRLYADDLDIAVVNGATMGLCVMSAVALWIWFVWFSASAVTPRRLAFLAALGGLIFLVTCVRIRDVDGALIPTFRFVWQPLADRALAKPIVVEEPPAEANADAGPKEPDAVAFTGFLGPNRDAVIAGPKLARDWSAHPPAPIWKNKIGAGWAAFAAQDGRAVTLEQRGDDEWVTCYSVATGQTLWAHSVPTRHEEVMGGIGPRSTPTIADGLVFTQGATGRVHCIDLATGKVVWTQNILELVGVDEAHAQQTVLWGRSGSPLVYQDLVIVPGGGPSADKCVSLFAFDKATGKEVWRGGDQQISYSSPIVATFAGVQQIVIVNESTITGHDPADGKQLWLYQWFGSSTANASTAQPHVMSGDRLFVSKGYGGGMRLVGIKREDDQWLAETLLEKTSVMKTKFTNVAILGDYAYALSDGVLECVAWETGKAKWKKGRYGQGQILAVGDLLLVQCESGEVALVEANPDKFVELGKFQALEGKTWNNLCLYGSRLLVRNSDEAACYELATE